MNRYRPDAWRRFFGRSLTRAAETRMRRARAHGQLLFVAAVALGGWAGVAVSGRPWLALAGSLWLVALVAMVDWHLGMLEDDAGRQLNGLGAANLVSLLRGIPVPALLVAPRVAFLALLIGAGLGDAIDGPLARWRGEESRLGRFLDAGVDAFVVGAAVVAAVRSDALPWWAAGVVLARYAAQWVGLALAYGAGIGVRATRGFVPWKLPGPILFGGLVLAAAHRSAGVTVVTVGALISLATLVASGLRSLRAQVTEG
jgi:phosphatidylglycerophosphate synthase